MHKVKQWLKNCIKRDDPLYNVLRFFYREGLGWIHIVRDTYIYCYVRRKLLPAMTCSTPLMSVHQDKKIIWTCWFQGMEQAPDIVKKCNQVLRQKENVPIVVLTDENFTDYVDLPQFILDKYKQGIISPTHFSDILRTALLYQHGGIWIDSTILLMKPIPAAVWGERLFFFQPTPSEITWARMSNHFLRAHAGECIMERTLRGVFSFWEHHDIIKDYFLYHYIFMVAVKMDEAHHRVTDYMMMRFSEENHILQKIMFEPFHQGTWEWVQDVSFMQKLTYKDIPTEHLHGSYYDYILKEGSLG